MQSHHPKTCLTDQSGERLALYVARNDCKKCKEFESEIEPLLGKLHYDLRTYYTNSDRDGPGSEAMYTLLDRYEIASVPVVLVVKDGEVVEHLADPVADIDEIKQCLKEGNVL